MTVMAVFAHTGLCLPKDLDYNLGEGQASARPWIPRRQVCQLAMCAIRCGNLVNVVAPRAPEADAVPDEARVASLGMPPPLSTSGSGRHPAGHCFLSPHNPKSQSQSARQICLSVTIVLCKAKCETCLVQRLIAGGPSRRSTAEATTLGHGKRQILVRLSSA